MRKKYQLNVLFIWGILLLALQGSVIAQPSSKENPLPLLTNELKGNIAPNVSLQRFYSFEAGPGDVSISLEVKTNEQWANISVEIFDRESNTLNKFDVSSGSDKKNVKLHLDARQLLVMRVNGPRNNQSGFFTLKIGGPIFLAKNNANPPKPPPIKNPTPDNNPLNNSPANTNARGGESNVNVTSTVVAAASGVNEISTDKKIALIIGNSKYDVGPLTNPENDARAMAKSLRDSGFEVMEHTNLKKREFEEALRAFGSKVSRGGVALFFFAGHGMQVKGANYLIPIGANIQKESDVEYEAVDAGRVMSEIESAGSRLNIVILDACRNNPFARSFRSGTRGLAVMNAPSGTVVAYATGPGEVASDGDGQNGLYTQELLKNLNEPNLKIEDVLKRTRISVKDKTKGQQVPWENTSLDGDFYFRKK